jgi:hypothetical protein
MDDVVVALHNMHHLISSLRPHQARTTLEEQLQQQIETKEAALGALRARTAAALAEVDAARVERMGGVARGAVEAVGVTGMTAGAERADGLAGDDTVMADVC